MKTTFSQQQVETEAKYEKVEYSTFYGPDGMPVSLCVRFVCHQANDANLTASGRLWLSW